MGGPACMITSIFNLYSSPLIMLPHRLMYCFANSQWSCKDCTMYRNQNVPCQKVFFLIRWQDWNFLKCMKGRNCIRFLTDEEHYDFYLQSNAMYCKCFLSLIDIVWSHFAFYAKLFIRYFGIKLSHCYLMFCVHPYTLDCWDGVFELVGFFAIYIYLCSGLGLKRYCWMKTFMPVLY